MCLILFSYDQHPQYRLILAANRDEFYARPTAAAHFWTDQPHVLAGRDLERMGTWLGVTTSGRFAAITNYREPVTSDSQAKSRGELVSGYLSGQASPRDYVQQMEQSGHLYPGFNLLIGDSASIYYYSNKSGEMERIRKGIHGLSNHLLNTPWPKVKKGKAFLKSVVEDHGNVESERLLQLLQDAEPALDHDLPDTGMGLERERMLSSLFIHGSDYGTRSSTVLLIDHHGHVWFTERRYVRGQGEAEDVSFQFDIQS